MFIKPKLSIRILPFALLTIALLSPNSIAGPNEPSVSIVCFPPPKSGTITVELFIYTDAGHTHGLPCSPPAVAIPAGVSGAAKAAIVAAALNGVCGLVASTTGSVVTLSNNGPLRYGVGLTSIEDSTGEYGQLDIDQEGQPHTSRKKVKLGGATTSGSVRFGDLASPPAVVPTAGRTIPQIYAALQALLGGTVTLDGLVLPIENGVHQTAEWEVTDLGLDIEIFVEFLDVSFETYPGTGEDLALSSSIGFAPVTSGVGEDVKTVMPGQFATVRFESPNNGFLGTNYALLGTFVDHTGGQRVNEISSLPGLYGSFAATVVLLGDGVLPALGLPALLPPGGCGVSFTWPNTGGGDLMVQAIITDPSAANGFVAASDGHVFEQP